MMNGYPILNCASKVIFHLIINRLSLAKWNSQAALVIYLVDFQTWSFPLKRICFPHAVKNSSLPILLILRSKFCCSLRRKFSQEKLNLCELTNRETEIALNASNLPPGQFLHVKMMLATSGQEIYLLIKINCSCVIFWLFQAKFAGGIRSKYMDYSRDWRAFRLC